MDGKGSQRGGLTQKRNVHGEEVKEILMKEWEAEVHDGVCSK